MDFLDPGFRRGDGFFERIKIDEPVRSQEKQFSVIPAKAGIQYLQGFLDSRRSLAALGGRE
jgi:hypothetical protein